MNKKKLILKVERQSNGMLHLQTKDKLLDIETKTPQGTVLHGKISYWEAFIVLSKQPRLTFYKQLPDQGF